MVTGEKPLIIGFGESLYDHFDTGPKLGGAPLNLCVHAIQLGARAVAECGGPHATQAGKSWRTVGLQAATLQRQNAQVRTGCAPSLGSQVPGRLGWHWSEAPEICGRPRKERLSHGGY